MSARCREYHIAVLGAGFAGLAAAAALAARGHAVTVVEGSSNVGGKARRVEAGGAVVDVGPTLLVDAAPLESLHALAPGGPSPLDGLTPIDPGLDVAFPGGRRLGLWRDPTRLEAELAALGSHARDDWRRMLELGACAARLTDRFHARGDVAGLRDLLRLVAPGGISLSDVTPFVRHRSLGALVRTTVRTPDLGRFLDHAARFLGLDALRAPAVALLIPYLLATRGVLHPTGGMSGLAGRLSQLAIRRGAVLRMGEPVDGLETEAGRVRAIRLAGGERLGVDAVVAALDPGLVAGWASSTNLAARVARRPPTLAARVAWWVVEGTMPDAAPHALDFPADHTAEPLYVARPTAVEPGLAAPGTTIIYALVHGPAGPAADPALADTLRRRVAEAGWWPAGHVLDAGVAGDGRPGYGLALSPGLLGSLPLSQRAAGLVNLWMAGAGVFPGPGVANALRSGLRAAALADEALAGGAS